MDLAVKEVVAAWGFPSALQSAHLEDGCSLEHLRHEGADTLLLAVAGADARKDGVPDRDARRVAGHKAADLCHQDADPHLKVKMGVLVILEGIPAD